jgi:hypothetical protein
MKTKKVTTLLIAAILAFGLIAAPAFAGTWANPDNGPQGDDSAPVYYLFYDKTVIDEDGNTSTIIAPVPHGQGVVKGYDDPVNGTVKYYFQQTTVTVQLPNGSTVTQNVNVTDIDDPSTGLSIFTAIGTVNGEATFNTSAFTVPVGVDASGNTVYAAEADFYLSNYHNGYQTYYLAESPL